METYERNKQGKVADFLAAQHDGSAINLLRKTFDGQFMKGIRTAAGSMIARCSFKDGGIYGSNFKRTTFVKCDFSGSQIYGTIFTKCDFNDCVFNDVEFSSTQFDKSCIFNNCSFVGTDIVDIKKVVGIPEQPDKIIGEDDTSQPTTEEYQQLLDSFFASEDFLKVFSPIENAQNAWKFTAAEGETLRLEVSLPEFDENTYTVPAGRLIFVIPENETKPSMNDFYNKMGTGENPVDFTIELGVVDSPYNSLNVSIDSIGKTFWRELYFNVRRIFDRMMAAKNNSGNRTKLDEENEGVLSEIVKKLDDLSRV